MLSIFISYLLANTLFVQGFTLSRSTSRNGVVPLSSAASDDEEKRMEMVRQLQKTFYNSAADEQDRPQLEKETGRVTNLPLWRVGWIEVPGRANCLNVHEGHYTNMFEKIISGPKPWYFGHLHLPGGTKAARTGEKRFELKSWRDEIQDTDRFDQEERSAVVGCLMRITDFRRLQDGRLTILVHALERFVVDEVVESFPHGVAHVQILPDTKDMPTKVDENFGKIARADAVRRSFQYHDYECDSIELPLPKDTEYMSTQDVGVYGLKIAKCLPFAFYSKNDTSLERIEPVSSRYDEGNCSFAGGQPLLEERLQADLVLRNPPPLPGVKSQTSHDADALEKFIWLALDDFCRVSDFVLPEEILCLLPPDMEYLDMGHPKQCLSDKYPKQRRQRRLSYHLPKLIENTNVGAAIPMRQVLLNTPSTQARLAAVLERFQLINDAVMGQFQ